MIHGEVLHGDGEGRSTGYPTANLDFALFEGVPDGIYAVWIWIDAVRRAGILVLGVTSTDTSLKKAEVYILDWQGDIYGKVVDVKIMQKIRDLQSFTSHDELRVMIEKDVFRARELLYQGR